MNIHLGHKFIRRGKRYIETVTDILETRSIITGELVNIRYVATHEFCGQTVTDRDICKTTIQRSEQVKP